jgi:hypothetical protein
VRGKEPPIAPGEDGGSATSAARWSPSPRGTTAHLRLAPLAIEGYNARGLAAGSSGPTALGRALVGRGVEPALGHALV